MLMADPRPFVSRVALREEPSTETPETTTGRVVETSGFQSEVSQEVDNPLFRNETGIRVKAEWPGSTEYHNLDEYGIKMQMAVLIKGDEFPQQSTTMEKPAVIGSVEKCTPSLYSRDRQDLMKITESKKYTERF